METTKLCPKCGQENEADELVCRFCHTHFPMVVQGYCAHCHTLRPADDQNRCAVCHNELVDIRMVSPASSGNGPAAGKTSPGRPLPAPQASAPPKRRKSPCLVQLFALLAIVYALYVFKDSVIGFVDPLIAGIQGVTLTPTPTFTPAATETPEPTSTPRATVTPLPTFTPPPPPLEVTFDTIQGLPVFTEVILVGRLDLMGSTKCTTLGDITTCGLLLENPDNTEQKITIFVKVGDGPNQMNPLPESYSQSDIQVHLDDGTTALVGYRLRVRGRVCITTSNNACIEYIDRIELVQLK